MVPAVSDKPVDRSREVMGNWLDERACRALDLLADFPPRHRAVKVLERYSRACWINEEVLAVTKAMEASGKADLATLAESNWIAEHMAIWALISQGRWEEASERVRAFLREMNQLAWRMRPRKKRK